MRDDSGKFIPGHSGNPSGRPRGQGIADIVFNEFQREHKETTRGAQILSVLTDKAIEGDLRAVKIAVDLMLNLYRLDEIEEIKNRLNEIETTMQQA